MKTGKSPRKARERLLAQCRKLRGSQQLYLLDYLWHASQAPRTVTDSVERELVEALDDGRQDSDDLIRKLTAATARLKEATAKGEG